jgi:hypothetical protein
MGFDILSNIASEVQLEEPGEDAVTDLMIKSLSRCIGDQDRFQVGQLLIFDIVIREHLLGVICLLPVPV